MTSPAAVKRIRFSPGTVGAESPHAFPSRPYTVTDTALTPADLGGAEADDLLIAILPPRPGEWPAPARPAISIHTFRAKGVRIERWLGRTIVSAPPGDLDNLIAALVEFDHLERELVRLETDVAKRTREAHADAKTAFVASYSKRAEWPRIRERIIHYTELRLDFAALEPRLNAVPHSVPPGVRRWLAPMLRKSDLADRAEALDGILETREDLYEGSSDRIADYWGWLYGHVLEIIIIALLLIEAIFMGFDVVLRLREG